MFWQILFGKSGFTSKIIDGLLKGNISCYGPPIFPIEFISLQEIFSIFYRPNILESDIKLLINKALKQGININVLDKDNDNTILLIAIKHHDYDVAEFLIKREANCNTPDKLATTPLHTCNSRKYS
ncbi:ankyrin repeat domain-containing protein [Rickettsia endosymbiont of Gonocerus acuteangulatus]|uniref:ankyrin repeat domain-containing protein n=1 Tax=Rickettsia endosymbiont of Gonocerus acuteangulatus TaxID=3066266 RepID=UPI003132DA1F